MGIGILDLLNQGGQFLAGRNAAQVAQADKLRQQKIEDEKNASALALQQALIEQYQANAADMRAQAATRGQAKPLTFQEQQAKAEGQIAPYDNAKPPEGFDPVGATVSNTVAHLGLPNVDPQMLFKVAQDRQDALAKQAEQTREANARIGASQAAAAAAKEAKDATHAQAAANAFDRRAKTTTDALQAIDQATTTLDEADKSNPVAYGSTLATFVRAADVNPQLRLGMLDYFGKNVDPSVAGRLDIWIKKLESGEYPVATLENFRNHLKALKQQDVARYNQLRDFEIKRDPSLEKWLHPAEDYLGNAGLGANAAANPYEHGYQNKGGG